MRKPAKRRGNGGRVFSDQDSLTLPHPSASQSSVRSPWNYLVQSRLRDIEVNGHSEYTHRLLIAILLLVPIYDAELRRPSG